MNEKNNNDLTIKLLMTQIIALAISLITIIMKIIILILLMTK